MCMAFCKNKEGVKDIPPLRGSRYRQILLLKHSTPPGFETLTNQHSINIPPLTGCDPLSPLSINIPPLTGCDSAVAPIYRHPTPDGVRPRCRPYL